jgi:hypothetical protein
MKDSAWEIEIGEIWYRNGPPNWERAPNSAAAVRDRYAAIKRFQRDPFATEFPSLAPLVERLMECGPRNRCGSGACPECLRASQRWLTTFITLGVRVGPEEEW